MVASLFSWLEIVCALQHTGCPEPAQFTVRPRRAHHVNALAGKHRQGTQASSWATTASSSSVLMGLPMTMFSPDFCSSPSFSIDVR